MSKYIQLVASTAYLLTRGLRILGQKQTVEFDIAPYSTLMHSVQLSAWSGVELEVLKLQISIDT